MHFDALTVACVAAELQKTIEGGRVQQVIAPDDQSIGMEIYAQRQRYYLLLNGESRSSRVHLTREKLRRGTDKTTPLLLLLRKYVRGAQLSVLRQPDVTERVLYFSFSHPEHGETQLVAEMIGQRGNLILVDAGGQILDCLHRLWESDGVQRPLMPKQPYAPPPPQTKLAPFFRVEENNPNVDSGMNAMAAERLTALAQLLQVEEPLWRVLVSNYAGISPTLAREVAWRATGEIDTAADLADATTVATALQGLWQMVETGDWQPGLWYQENKIAGFAPYVIHGYDEFQPISSISVALEQYEAASATETTQDDTPEETMAMAIDSYAALRGSVEQRLQQAEQRLSRQLAGLAKDEPAPGEAETLRMQAEWLLALNHQIEPEQRALEIDLGDRMLTISLREGKTPIEQAEQMFDRAAKLERAAQIIPERRQKLQDDLDYLAQLALDLTQAENQPEIAAIQAEIAAMGLLPSQQSAKQPKQAPESQPHRYYTDQGFEIVVGRNARQNEKVTFDIAKSEDLWLHARGAPGAHVVIRSGGQAVDDETLENAARLAAYHSKLVGERAATVIVTPRKFVSRAPGGHPGQVLVRQEETITVSATLPAAFAE